MNRIGLLALTAAALLAGCSSNTQQDNYREASFELCNT
ncbi:lipoprotein, partial [Vibrio mimicus]